MEDVGSELPAWGSEEEVVQYLTSKYLAAGERASNAPMPVNFKEHGVYKLTHEGKQWVLHHNFLGKRVELLDIDDELGAQPLCLEHNHSDRRAMIRIKGTTYSRSCEQCFLSSPPCSSSSSVGAPSAAFSETSMVTPVKRARMSLMQGQRMLALPQPSPNTLRTGSASPNSPLPLTAPPSASPLEASPAASNGASPSEAAEQPPLSAGPPSELAPAPPTVAEPQLDEASFVPEEED